MFVHWSASKIGDCMSRSPEALFETGSVNLGLKCACRLYCKNVTGNPMTTQYYKRHFDETRTEQSDSWGTCDFYFETNQNGEILRQIEVYENGKTLKYSGQFTKDEFGFLADQPIDLSNFERFSITKNDFEFQWQK
jgi:hypothetical protein